MLSRLPVKHFSTINIWQQFLSLYCIELYIVLFLVETNVTCVLYKEVFRPQ